MQLEEKVAPTLTDAQKKAIKVAQEQYKNKISGTT